MQLKKKSGARVQEEHLLPSDQKLTFTFVFKGI